MQLGFNPVSVFVTRSNTLSSLDRNTGVQQWQIELPTAPSTTPTADEEYLYVAFASGRLYEFALPRYRPNPRIDAKKAKKAEVLPPPGSAAKSGEAAAAPGQAPTVAGPVLLWDFATQAQLDVPPIISPGIVVMVSSTGSFFALSTQFDKHEIIPFHFQADVAQPFARHGDVAYVATKDSELYDLDLLTSRSLWRLALGGKILQQPLITDDDIYVVTQGNGLDRVERSTGLERWRKANALVERCLAVNAKFIYGLDRYGKLLVLDRERGTLLSSYDMRDFVIPIANERTDRLYLAAHDGLIVGLRDKEYAAPLRNKKLEETPGAPSKPLTKPAEKTKEEGTDTPKDNDKDKPKDKGDADANKDKPKEKGEEKKP